MKQIQLFTTLILLMPLFSMAQDAVLSQGTHTDRNYHNFEVSASYGYANYSYPLGKSFYTLSREGKPPFGVPANRGESPKIAISASAYLIKSVDVGLSYTANEMRYAITVYTGEHAIGYAARPASRVSVFSKYHYAIKNLEIAAGPSIGTVMAPGGLKKNSKGVTYSLAASVRYRIAGGLYASISADYTKDYLGNGSFETKGAAMSEGWATTGGLVFKF